MLWGWIGLFDLPFGRAVLVRFSMKTNMLFHMYVDFIFRARTLISNYPGGTMSLTSLELFKNLSDHTRLNIVLLLRETGELCVCDLCTALEQSQPKISRHLAMLRESGLLLDRKQGKWVHYRLSPHIPAWAGQVIEHAWSSQRDEIQSVARRLTTEKGCC